MPLSDDPGRFRPGTVVLTEADRRLVVSSMRPYRDRGLIVAFEGILDRPQAETLRGSSLTVASDDRRSLEAGEWWPEDLVGLEVVNAVGVTLGTVEDVVVGSFQDRLLVSTPGGRLVEVPFVDEFVGDPSDGRIVVTPPPGLFD